MAEFPMLPFWTDAYLADTTHLTTTEHGAYLLLLIAMWRTKAKRLPNNDKMLARFARLTPGQWARIKPTLMPFFIDHGDEISQARLTDEADAVRRHSVKQSDKAKARWLAQKDSSDAVAMPDGMPERCSLPLPLPNQERKKEDTSADAAEPVSLNGRYRWQGAVIRLNERDFNRWEQSFKHLDLPADLASLDAWLESPECSDADRKNWFFIVAGALKNRNATAKAVGDAPRRDRLAHVPHSL